MIKSNMDSFASYPYCGDGLILYLFSLSLISQSMLGKLKSPLIKRFEALLSGLAESITLSIHKSARSCYLVVCTHIQYEESCNQQCLSF